MSSAGERTAPSTGAAAADTRRLMRDFTVELPFTDAAPNVEAGRHAMSIDERRRAFDTRQWSSERPGLQERWFAGVHSDVGGGYLERELAEIALAWILDGARKSGLDFRPDRIPAITPEDAVDPIHRSDGGLWWILGTKDRKAPDDAVVDETVYQRMGGLPDYRPAVPVPQ